jgi:hypothetical protein
MDGACHLTPPDGQTREATLMVARNVETALEIPKGEPSPISPLALGGEDLGRGSMLTSPQRLHEILRITGQEAVLDGTGHAPGPVRIERAA